MKTFCQVNHYIALSATASHAGGTISKVEFYNGTQLLATKMAAPYTFNWTNVPFGTYSLTTKATDNSGSTTTSAAVSVMVKVVHRTSNIVHFFI
jgi:chitinase